MAYLSSPKLLLLTERSCVSGREGGREGERKREKQKEEEEERSGGEGGDWDYTTHFLFQGGL